MTKTLTASALSLRTIDSLVFNDQYFRIMTNIPHLIPVEIQNSNSNSGFLGYPCAYRGHYYASVNPDYPEIRFIDGHHNSHGLPMPICAKSPNRPVILLKACIA